MALSFPRHHQFLLFSFVFRLLLGFSFVYRYSRMGRRKNNHQGRWPYKVLPEQQQHNTTQYRTPKGESGVIVLPIVWLSLSFACTCYRFLSIILLSRNKKPNNLHRPVGTRWKKGNGHNTGRETLKKTGNNRRKRMKERDRDGDRKTHSS